jgi:hypothetical protein
MYLLLLGQLYASNDRMRVLIRYVATDHEYCEGKICSIQLIKGRNAYSKGYK